MKTKEYRLKINELDKLIEVTKDADKKIALIDENIKINEEYIHKLKKSIPVRIVFCVILSIFFLLGLAIFLPQIIVRKEKAKICEDRIVNLKVERQQLVEKLNVVKVIE